MLSGGTGGALWLLDGDDEGIMLGEGLVNTPMALLLLLAELPGRTAAVDDVDEESSDGGARTATPISAEVRGREG